MAEFLPFLAIGGAGGQGFGEVISQVIRQIGRFIRFAITKIWHFLKWLAHYLFMYARLFARYVDRLYDRFARDPIHFLQFAGSLAILVYYGLL